MNGQLEVEMNNERVLEFMKSKGTVPNDWEIKRDSPQ